MHIGTALGGMESRGNLCCKSSWNILEPCRQSFHCWGPYRTFESMIFWSSRLVGYAGYVSSLEGISLTMHLRISNLTFLLWLVFLPNLESGTHPSYQLTRPSVSSASGIVFMQNPKAIRAQHEFHGCMRSMVSSLPRKRKRKVPCLPMSPLNVCRNEMVAHDTPNYVKWRGF